MFLWILIIFTIALIFGVIKIEQLKEIADKLLPRLKALLSAASEKATELKEKIDNKDSSEQNDNDNSDK